MWGALMAFTHGMGMGMGMGIEINRQKERRRKVPEKNNIEKWREGTKKRQINNHKREVRRKKFQYKSVIIK